MPLIFENSVLLKNSITTPFFKAIDKFKLNLRILDGLKMLSEAVLIFCLALYIDAD